MDSQTPASGPTGRNAAEPSQPPQAQQHPQPSSSLPPSSSSTRPISAPNPIPNPNRNPNPIQTQTQSQASISRPPTPAPPQSRPPPSFNSTLPPPPPPQQQQQSHFPSSFPSTASLISNSAAPRGSMAIGVPTHHQGPSPPFSSSFGQHFGALNRTGVNVTESSTSNSNTSQVKAPAVQGMGMLGSTDSSSQLRPGGMASHQHRPVQSSLRPPLPSQNNQSIGSQSFQGHGLMRTSSVGSPTVSPSPSASQSMQSFNQPWLSSGPQGKPPLPSPSYRQQLNPQSLQQRSHISQQQQSKPAASQQQQPLPSNQPQEHFGQQQVPLSRAAIHVPHQQPVTRIQGPGNQKPSSLVAAQSSAVQTGIQSRLSNAETEESCNSILSKRSIHELVNQVDPLEKLDTEVADILVDIAENFLESIWLLTSQASKSTTLEAKDILLHLEKNRSITLPGFGGDEIKSYRRQPTSDFHKERLAAIKKSVVATEAANAKGSSGQASGSAKGSQAKTPLNVIGSPNFKNS